MRSLLRNRVEGEHARVGFVELFFDLVFVFAITQVSHGLLAHLTPLGALQAAMLLAAVWWAWIFTSWATNWLDPEREPVQIALFVLMGIGLVRKVVTLGAYVACPEATECAAGLLVCSCCHAVEHLPDARPAAIAGAPQDYLIEQVVLEASGLCPLCR